MLALAFLATFLTSVGAGVQPAQKLRIALEMSSEGRADDALAARLLADVRKGLEAIGDVELVPAKEARRTIRIAAGSATGPYAASLIVTERYDRETLMVLGIEDDETAERMMALHIVNEHQIFTGADLADIARRIVASVNSSILARLRAVPKR